MNKTNIKNLIILFITIFIIASVVYFLRANKDEISELINLSPYYFYVMVFVTLIINLIYSEKLLIIYKYLGLSSIKRYQWLKIFFVARFLNLHLPQGGLAYRSYQLKQEYNFTYSDSLGVSAVYSLLESIIIVAVCTLSLTYIHFFISEVPKTIFILSIFFIAALATTPFVLPIFPRVLTKLKLSWMTDRFEMFNQAILKALTNKHILIEVTFLNIVTVILFCVWIYFCFLFLGLEFETSYIFMYAMIIQLSATIRIIPGNWGVMELVSGTLSLYLGSEFSSGVLISLVTRLSGYSVFLIVGFVYLTNQSLKKLSK